MTGPFGLLNPVWAGTSTAQLMSEDAVLAAMLRVEAAWAQTLVEAGEADPASAAALRRISEDPALAGLSTQEIAAASPGGGNPVIPMLAAVRAVLKQTGDSDAALHRGATSQDILDTALMLLVHEAARGIGRDLRRAGDALSRLSQEHRETLCVARSLTQHALPTSFGLRTAGWLDGLTLSLQRLEQAADGLPLQWGGAAGTQAALQDAFGAENASAMTVALAARLGLAPMRRPWHTQRHAILEISSALAEVLAQLGKAAGDVLTLQRPEIAEVREPQAAGRGGSSAMPQKQNPVLSTLIRSAALAGPGQLSTVYAAATAAEDERPAGGWHAEWPSLAELVRLTGGASARAAELFEGLQVRPDSMQANLALSGDAVLSERVLSRLSGSFPGGKQALQQLLKRSAVEGLSLRSLLQEQLQAHELSTEGLDQLLDPTGYLGRAQEFIATAVADFREVSGAADAHSPAEGAADHV